MRQQKLGRTGREKQRNRRTERFTGEKLDEKVIQLMKWITKSGLDKRSCHVAAENFSGFYNLNIHMVYKRHVL